MSFLSLFVILFNIHPPLAASYTKQPFPADSIQRREIRPGVIHTEYTLAGPRTVDVISVDLTRAEYALTSYRPDSLTPTSEQARHAGRAGKGNIIAAMNADFFSFETHWPVGNQIAEGVPVTGLRTDRSHLSISNDGRVHFGPASFSGFIEYHGDSIAPISGLNAKGDTGGVFLYTSFWGESTRTSEVMTDVVLQQLSPDWNIGDTTKFVAEEIFLEGNAPIRKGMAVLSFGDGILSIDEGDTIQLVLRYGGHSGRLRTMLGGAGKVLLNGELPEEGDRLNEKIGQKFILDRHPRSFVAIDKDTTHFFLCTVDGRQQTSVGMNFSEMAEFLLTIGGWNAINLDGGGSTTMVVDGKIVNSPSDRTGERPVANTLLVVEVP